MGRPFWAYILRCSDGSYYTGHTDDIERRYAEHSAGEGCAYTRSRRPVRLMWAEEFTTRDDAFRAERQIKNWSRAKKEALIREDWDALCQLARKRFRKRGADASPAHPE